MTSNPDFDDMTVTDLITWLEQQGIPSEFCDIFSGRFVRCGVFSKDLNFCSLSDNYIDGKEFTKLTEAEVKQMVKAIGIAKKIIRLIPKACIY